VSSTETLAPTRVFPVIGLEVHAQLLTRSKMFCACPVTVGAPANSATCPICLGFPGTLPVLNRHAVTLAIRLAAAVGAEIHRDSRFARKNYFYPDLPKGYQITQYDRPLSTGGAIAIDTEAGVREIPLVRIHLEEDAGKSLHDNPYDDVPDTVTLVEWNRAGVPLAEIVSEPELRSSAEAAAYLTELRKLLRTLSVSEANMEEGNLRCDANVSVRLSESDPYGTRVEIKNLNSIRNVARAIDFEVRRQAEVLAAGGRIRQETRLFDAGAAHTRPMRSKEEAHDYRYFPEPDLGMLKITEEWLAEVSASLRETPRDRKTRFREQYGLTDAEAELLASARPLAEYFEAVASGVSPKTAAAWTSGEVLHWLKEQKLSPEEAGRFSVAPAALTELLVLVESKEISGSAAKTVLEEMVRTGRRAGEIVKEKNLIRLSDETELSAVIAKLLAESASQVAAYRSGKTATFGWFVGQVMKATGGRADPEAARRLLAAMLEP
jgi:aspartyl-tRNA(Asn)/glutamyl-tRNA(Gln) amidotransferase subunit B